MITIFTRINNYHKLGHILFYGLVQIPKIGQKKHRPNTEKKLLFVQTINKIIKEKHAPASY